MANGDTESVTGFVTSCFPVLSLITHRYCLPSKPVEAFVILSALEVAPEILVLAQVLPPFAFHCHW